MSQYDPNLNQALVDARVAARVAEASRSRLASRAKCHSQRILPVRTSERSARAEDLVEADRLLTLVR